MKLMTKWIAVLCILTLACGPAMAFLYNVPILAKEEIKALSDEDLEETYIEARIEEQASGEFHNGAGFSSAKDYTARKKLLRYIFELRREIGNRESLEADNIDEYLK